MNIMETQKREHSRKPDELYPIIEACSPGPYVELFARYAQSGRTAWGNEADEHVVPKGRQYRATGSATGSQVGQLHQPAHGDGHDAR